MTTTPPTSTTNWSFGISPCQPQLPAARFSSWLLNSLAPARNRIPPTVISSGAANFKNFSFVIWFFTSRRTLCSPGRILMVLEDEELLPRKGASSASPEPSPLFELLPLDDDAPPAPKSTTPPGRSNPSASTSVAEPKASLFPSSPSISKPSPSLSTSSQPALAVSTFTINGSTEAIFAFTVRRFTFTRTMSPTLKTAPELTLTPGIFCCFFAMAPLSVASPRTEKSDVPAADGGIVLWS
mmetsp:Transcript_28085/g.71185  ORF Transcript_28085/g.71185 Transcript_28085/m.71185 type:complete len:240 (-) Transcript_28085:405-1124(-)